MQRKRVTVSEMLHAANWVRENIQNLQGKQLTKVQWAETVSEGSGIAVTPKTAVDILLSCGVVVEKQKPDDPMVERVRALEQQVADLYRLVTEAEVVKPKPATGCFPFAHVGERVVAQ